MRGVPSFRRMVVGLAVLCGIAVVVTVDAGGATQADSTSPNVTSSVQQELDALAAKARPATFGVTVIDLKTGHHWGVNQDDALPMMSVFKAPVAATVLDMVDRNDLSLSETVTIGRDDLRKGASDIARSFKGKRMTFTVGQLLNAAVSHSDNTAIDALIKRIGGPDVVTRFLRTHRVEGMRVDLDEGGIERVFSGLDAGERPRRNETVKQREMRLWRGYQAFLADPRNRSTPKAAAAFLRKLWNGDLLSGASTRRLLDLMYAQTKPVRLRAGLPHGAKLADKCGTSVSLRGMTAAFNDIGIVTLPNGHAVIIAAFLTASRAKRKERTGLFADLTRQVAAHLR